ncbi:MAG: type II toxin-antitoxin system HicA family toxin [Acholeplasmatales bacterium]|nr:type II toxin-antitoxin system HicA family toxin [Acholeplasmatales bacterium]
MASIDKLIEYFQKSPLPKEVSLDDFKKYLEHYGFIINEKRGKGSHIIATREDLSRPYVIPSKNGKTVSFVYLQKLNKIIVDNKEE